MVELEGGVSCPSCGYSAITSTLGLGAIPAQAGSRTPWSWLLILIGWVFVLPVVPWVFTQDLVFGLVALVGYFYVLVKLIGVVGRAWRDKWDVGEDPWDEADYEELPPDEEEDLLTAEALSYDLEEEELGDEGRG